MAASKSTGQQITITGRLLWEPILRETKAGVPVTNLRIAQSGGDGTVTYYTAVLWEKAAEDACKTIHLGDVVEVTGTPMLRIWVDKNGKERESLQFNSPEVRHHGPKVSPAPPSRQAELELE